MVTVLRPLSTSELLDRTFHLYRNNFIVFVTIAAIPQLAVLALQLTLPNRIDPRHVSIFFMRSLEIWLASFVAIEIGHAASVIAVSNLHLEKPVAIGSSYAGAKSSMLRVIGISCAVLLIPMLIAVPVAVVLMMLVGFAVMALGPGHAAAMGLLGALSVGVAFVLVGLKWWLAWSLVVPVTVLEGGGFRASIRRSKSLTLGRRGRIFVIYLLIAILAWVVSSIIQLPLILTIGWHAYRNPTGLNVVAHTFSAVGAFVGASLVGALGEIALTLVYYDERVRKEGFDLQLIMSGLQGGAQAVAASPTA